METTLTPSALLNTLLLIERDHGRDRTREVPLGPRTLDLDLLYYADRQLDAPDLTLPHPRLHQRRFVLTPLADVAGAWRHPVAGKSVDEMLRNLDDGERVERLA
ncbi:putative 2-amino-4-hydroxy-6-hydroxymethyldihydropteridine pyrophosphokinase [Magnetofaba australis IT-1]|uniref:2-amino-4-hydroxy-6-hydroxymethyldihydropteridine pyrophosphokinase n=1 Tax=Magnetofaba australis IT-1 TaxID=1434232 RepID=A0A1Y2K6H2_9PROT|nr:putative 2-amino-4-hydroxy-6-hydroxymethyldihydropteridine pyrophosphokinase [Magnetofaba australis IT-1]